MLLKYWISPWENKHISFSVDSRHLWDHCITDKELTFRLFQSYGWIQVKQRGNTSQQQRQHKYFITSEFLVQFSQRVSGF